MRSQGAGVCEGADGGALRFGVVNFQSSMASLAWQQIKKIEMRILIVEEALKTGSGHWPVYIGGIASELRKAGDEVDVLVHRDATDSVVDSVGGVRWLNKNCWSDKDCQGFVGGLRHSYIFASDLKSWILANEPYDFVCMLTIRLQHLVALTVLEMRSFQSRGFFEKTRKTRFLTLFVQGFGEYVEGPRAEKYRRIQGGRLGALKMLLASRGRYFGFHGSSAYPFRGAPLAAWSCFRLLRRGVRKGSVILAAETLQMRGKLENFAKCPVELFPHPVVPGPSLNPVQESKSAFIDSGFSESTTSPSKNPIVIICPGFARYEKGSDLLLGAIEAIVEERLRKAGLEPRVAKNLSTESEPLHFIVQWPEPFAMPDGKLIGSQADFASRTESFRSGKYLSSSGEEVDAGITVEFLNHNLTAEEYRRLLQKADFVILPYRKSSYHNRVSRVAIEAAMEGVGLIYMAGTWSQEIVELIGTGVEIAEESVSALKVAIFQAIGHSGKLSEAGRIRVRAFHSVQLFRKILLDSSSSARIRRGFSRVQVAAKRVALSGWYGETNLGDDFLLLAALNALPKNLMINVLGRREGLEALAFSGGRIKIDETGAPLKQFLRIFKFDDFILGGGGLFPELKSSFSKYLQLIAPILFGKRLIIIGISVNPNKGGFESKVWRFLVKKSALFTVRDYKTKDYLKKCCFERDEVPMLHDLVFSGIPINAPKSSILPSLPSRYALICPAWFDSIRQVDEYQAEKRLIFLVDEFRASIKVLLDFGITPVWFSFFPRQDRILINAFKKLWTGDPIQVLEYGKDFQAGDALSMFRNAEFNLCMRFHSLVLAMIARRNFAAICYDYKTSCLLEMVGLSDAGIDFGLGSQICYGYERDLPIGSLSNLVKRRLELNMQTCRVLEQEVPNLEHQSAKNFEMLRELYTA